MQRTLIAMLCGLMSWSFAWAGTLPRHERVIWLENPATEATISWTTDDRGSLSRVYYDTESRGARLGAYRYQMAPQFQGSFKKGLFSWKTPHYHHAQLKQLTPNTDYYFVVETDGAVSSEYWFRTAPRADQAVSLLFGGDSRSDEKQRMNMNRLMRDMFESNGEILALVHGGDFVYDGSNWQEWESWLTQHALTRSANGRILPIVPTRGNHEVDAELFNQIWAWPGGGEAYYTSEIGALSIVVLNTEISLYGDQQTWLGDTLARLRATRPWVVANYHRPAYPAVKSPSAAKEAWVPLFERYQIDLAFESDGHVYKQTVPIYRDRLDLEKGVVYVGEGGLGVKQRTPDASRWFLQAPGYTQAAHHVQLLEVSADRMEYKALDEYQDILGRLSFAPRPKAWQAAAQNY